MPGQIGTAQAMHVELAALQGTQQCLLAAVEEVVALTCAGVIETRQKREVALAPTNSQR